MPGSATHRRVGCTSRPPRVGPSSTAAAAAHAPLVAAAPFPAQEVPPVSKTFSVMMLSVLREPFEQWVRERGFVVEHVPGSDPDTLVVVPDPEIGPPAEVYGWNAGSGGFQ